MARCDVGRFASQPLKLAPPVRFRSESLLHDVVELVDTHDSSERRAIKA
jgi:hypothetical protein